MTAKLVHLWPLNSFSTAPWARRLIGLSLAGAPLLPAYLRAWPFSSNSFAFEGKDCVGKTRTHRHSQQDFYRRGKRAKLLKSGALPLTRAKSLVLGRPVRNVSQMRAESSRSFTTEYWFFFFGDSTYLSSCGSSKVHWRFTVEMNKKGRGNMMAQPFLSS